MKRRTLKITAWIAGSVIGTVVLLVVALLIGGNTAPGRAMIERLVRDLTAGNVSIIGLTGSFPQHLLVERLELKDAKGIWLSADRIALDWSPLAWLAGGIKIDALHAADLDMERLPVSTGPPSVKPPVIPRIDAANVSVDLLKLGAELAGHPAALVLKGSAHLRSIENMSFDATARRIDADGDYVLKLSFDARRMDAVVSLREPASGPLENILGLPGLGALTANASLHGPRTAERLEMAVDAGAVRGRANGLFNLRDLSADLDFAFDSPALEPHPGIGWERASVRGRWHGSVKAPNADGRIEIDRLRLPGDLTIASLSAQVSAQGGAAKLRARIEGLKIPGPNPALLADSALLLDASMQLDQKALPLQLTATHRLFALQAEATAASGQRAATVQIKLPALAAFSALVGQDIRGSAQINGEARAADDDVRLKIDAGADLQPSPAIWSAAAGKRLNVRVAGAITPAAFVLDSLQVAGGAASIGASGELSRSAPSLRLQWKVDVTDLKTLAPALAGTLQAEGTLQGATNALSLAAKLSSNLSVHGSQAGLVSANLAVRGLPSAPTGTMEMEGSLDGSPLHVDVLADRARDGDLHARIGRAAWKSASADGEITVGEAKGRSHGQVHIKIAELADLQQLLGSAVAGSLDAQALLRTDRGETHADVHVQASGLALGGFAGDAQLAVEGVPDSLNFKLAVQAPHVNGTAASAVASGLLSYPGREVSLTAASADYRGLTLRLLAPARIAFGQGVRVDDLKLGVQRAVIEIEGAAAPQLDLKASVRGIDPVLVNAFAPGLLETGDIAASATVQGDPASPTGEVTATAKNVRLHDDAAIGLPPIDAHATARLKGDHAEIEAGLDAGSASSLMLTGTAPLIAGGTMNLEIHGKFDVGMFNPLLEARGQHASGELLVDAAVRGTPAEPRIGGTLSLAKGSVRDYSRGLGLTDITASLVGADDALQIKSLSAAAAPGSVSMTGSVGILRPGIPVDIRIKAVNAQPIASKLVTANLDADLHVSGKVTERLDIVGKVKLHRTLIGVPNSLPPNVAVLNVRRRGKSAVAPDKQLVIGLDLSIESLQGILVQGRGLDAEVAGDLHLSGTTDAPLVSGGFELQRGTFSIGSSKLNFNTGGRVSFNGAGLKNKIDPTLDFTAQSTVGDVTATLQITGLADAPQFEFTSSPSLAQDEIMARLLFGAPAAQLTGLQLAETGAALATLSGVGGNTGLNPLAKIQRSLGLDRLNFGAGPTNAAGTESTGASIEAGRYISRRVFIVAKQNTTGTSQLEADVDLTKHLKLQTRVGNGASVAGTTPENDPGSSVGLSYQIEY